MLSTLSTESEAWDSDGSYTICVHGLGHGHFLLPADTESVCLEYSQKCTQDLQAIKIMSGLEAVVAFYRQFYGLANT